MTVHSFVLTDADANQQFERFDLRPTDGVTLAGGDDWSVAATTLHGGLSEGVSVVDICNGPLSLAILPTRGMGVWRGRFRELPLEWKSPVARPVHPSFVNLHDRNGLGWLNGFNELMCRCGLAFNGPPGQDGSTAVTLHGRIANLPAHHVELHVDTDGPGVIELVGTIEEASMFGPRLQLVSRYRFRIGHPSCEIIDEVTNLGGQPTELSLLYHINIGRPFLEDGGSNAVAFRELAPRDSRSAEGVETHALYGPPQAGFVEQAYYYRPATDAQGWTMALLHNRMRTAGFAVLARSEQLPCFTVWKNTQSEAEGYVTGLEPGVNFPNFRAFERGQKRLPVLAPNQTYRCEQRWEFADNAADVHELLSGVEQVQATCRPIVHLTPQPGWSPAGTPSA